MSTPANPMELIDRYLQAVRFWLPKTRQQAGLLAELGDDLRSQVEEREAELGRALDKNEVSEILKRCGSPMLVASRLGPKRSLIGPTLFPIYWFVLKMVLFWILVPLFIFIIGPINVAKAGYDWPAGVLNTMGALWSGLFVAAGTITLVFAVLERTQVFADIECKWDPGTLPPLQQPDRKPSLIQAVCELAFNWFGLVWLLLLPHYPILVFGPAKAFLAVGPLWHQFYVPIVLLAVLGLLRSTIVLARPQWEWFPTSSQLLQVVITMILVHFMLHAATQTPGGDWHPFVVIAAGAKNSVQAIRVAAVVNVSIMIGLASAWLGLSIAVIVHAWQFLRYLRNRASRERQPLFLQLQ